MGYKCTFPILYQEMKDQKRLKKQEFDTKSIDWKGETKKNYLYLAAFSKIIDGMSKDKEKGNEHFKKAEYEQALVYYKSALDLAKQKENDEEIDKIIENGKSFYNLKYDYLKISTILYSNSSMANLKLEHYSRSICNALKGNRFLERLDKLMDNEEKFEKDFGNIKTKIEWRMRESWKHQDL